MVEDDSVKVAQGLNVIRPNVQECFPVAFSDWDFVKNKIVQIKSPKKILAFLASNLSGIFASGVIGLICFPNSLKDSHKIIFIILWIVTIIALLISVICFIIDHQFKNLEIQQERDNIVDHMNRIERPYEGQREK